MAKTRQQPKAEPPAIEPPKTKADLVREMRDVLAQYLDSERRVFEDRLDRVQSVLNSCRDGEPADGMTQPLQMAVLIEWAWHDGEAIERKAGGIVVLSRLIRDLENNPHLDPEALLRILAGKNVSAMMGRRTDPIGVCNTFQAASIACRRHGEAEMYREIDRFLRSYAKKIEEAPGGASERPDLREIAGGEES